jgi:hypothetical protein
LNLGDNPGRFIEQRMNKLGVSAEKFDFALFLQHLILPAYWVGLARAAAEAGLPLALIGRGWDKWPDLADYARGAPESPRALVEQILACAAMIHPVPTTHAHSMDMLGRPVVQPAGTGTTEFLNAARHALAGKAQMDRRAIPPLSIGRTLSLIPTMRWPRSSEEIEKCSD